jgi:hypothetical protein
MVSKIYHKIQHDSNEINSIEMIFSHWMRSFWGATKGVGWDNFINYGENRCYK